MVRNFVFVETDRQGRTRAHDRKRIRSKCMEGKNWRIGVGPVPVSVHQAEMAETQSGDSGSSLSHPSSLQQVTAPSTKPSRNRNGSPWYRLPNTQMPGAVSIPRAPISDFSILAHGTDERERSHLVHCK
jgi:hypothetical protein